MSTMRKIKTRMVEDITANPHRRRFLVQHRKIVSEIDPKREARKWVASKFSRKVVIKKAIRNKLRKLLKRTESIFHENQLRYKAMKEQAKKKKLEMAKLDKQND